MKVNVVSVIMCSAILHLYKIVIFSIFILFIAVFYHDYGYRRPLYFFE